MTPLPTCTKCARSPWVHHLRGSYLYCNEIGGLKSSYDLDMVNTIRAAVGKKKATVLQITTERDTKLL